MQRMIMIPEERYDQMLETYDKLMNELAEIRTQLRGEEYGPRRKINKILDTMDEEQIEKVLLFIQGVAGGAK